MARDHNDLRDSFVEMLFALALGQIAIHAYDVVEASDSLVMMLPALSHLALGGVLIAASWVGWLTSLAPGKEAPKSVFSHNFVNLLIDVVLVVFYFLLVQDVEVQQVVKQGTNAINDIGTRLTGPTSQKEAKWLIWTFCTYALWDAFHDGAKTFAKCSFIRWLLLVFTCCLVSLASAGLALLAMYLSPQTGARIHQVVAIDVALIATVMAFRAGKIIEKPIADFFKIGNLDPFHTKREETSMNLLACLLVYSLGLAFSGHWVVLTQAFDKFKSLARI